jgi:hypothetical protein
MLKFTGVLDVTLVEGISKIKNKKEEINFQVTKCYYVTTKLEYGMLLSLVKKREWNH